MIGSGVRGSALVPTPGCVIGMYGPTARKQFDRSREPLVELDPTVSAADVAQARHALLNAEIDVACTQALVDHATGKAARFKAPAGAPATLVREQQALIEAKISDTRHHCRACGRSGRNTRANWTSWQPKRPSCSSRSRSSSASCTGRWR